MIPRQYEPLSRPSFFGYPPVLAFAKKNVTKYFEHNVAQLQHVFFNEVTSQRNSKLRRRSSKLLEELLEPVLSLHFLRSTFSVHSSWKVCFSASPSSSLFGNSGPLLRRHVDLRQVSSKRKTHGKCSFQMSPKRVLLSKLHLLSDREADTAHSSPMPQ